MLTSRRKPDGLAENISLVASDIDKRGIGPQDSAHNLKCLLIVDVTLASGEQLVNTASEGFQLRTDEHSLGERANHLYLCPMS
jgi:hypothetical protein